MRVLTVLASVCLLSGCQIATLQGLRSLTYPPDFHFITQQEIRTTMGELANEMVWLDRALATDAELRADGTSIVESLQRMRALAESLKGGAKSNHARIDVFAPMLQEDIALAIIGAQRVPVPDYYYAGRLIGSCTYCHAFPSRRDR